MGRRIARFAARAAIMAALWWLPWAYAFARDVMIFDWPAFMFVPALVALAQGIFASLVLMRIETKSRREVDLLWLLRARARIDDRAERRAGVDRRVACPWCGGDALTRRAKATMGPAVRAPCASCGEPVSVSAKPVLAIVAGSVAALPFWLPERSVEHVPLAWLGLLPIALGVLVAFVANDRLPLVARAPSVD